jgi:hypothetical protein
MWWRRRGRSWAEVRRGRLRGAEAGVSGNARFLGFWELFFRGWRGRSLWRRAGVVGLGGGGAGFPWQLGGLAGSPVGCRLFGLRWSGAAVCCFSGGSWCILRILMIQLGLAGIWFAWLLVGRSLRVVNDGRGRGGTGGWGPRQYRGLGRGAGVGASAASGRPALRAGRWLVSC